MPKWHSWKSEGRVLLNWRKNFCLKILRFCLENDTDYIIHSIYQGKQEISYLKKLIADENERLQRENRSGNEVKIIAKLENEEAIKDIEGIL